MLINGSIPVTITQSLQIIPVAIDTEAGLVELGIARFRNLSSIEQHIENKQKKPNNNLNQGILCPGLFFYVNLNLTTLTVRPFD